jgi:hypothetical protein
VKGASLSCEVYAETFQANYDVRRAWMKRDFSLEGMRVKAYPLQTSSFNTHPPDSKRSA